MSEIQAVVLGLIQGITEFLPVSSSGHLTIFKAIFGVETENLSFEIAVHAATVLSTIVALRKQIWKLLGGFFTLTKNPEKEYIFKIAVSMIPVFIVGIFFKDAIEGVFGSGLLIVGIMLMFTAVLLSLSEILAKRQGASPLENTMDEKDSSSISYKDAFIMGLAQAIAVLPGLSRSGATISTGLILGVKKSAVAQFSFLMVLVPVLGEAFLELISGNFSGAESGISLLPLCLGFLSAFLSGLFACVLMIKLVMKAKLWGFAIYCALVGIACVVSTLLA
ncbi:MAG: undecaprenyl-diphosphate phosphatase [Bacteroidales bacterium]